jgi:hypothetical protein
MGQEDHMHLMFKFKDGDVEPAVELGSSVVSKYKHSLCFSLGPSDVRFSTRPRPSQLYNILTSNNRDAASDYCVQVTLGTIITSPNRIIECRLKSPEKGKVRILAEPIDADTV